MEWPKLLGGMEQEDTEMKHDIHTGRLFRASVRGQYLVGSVLARRFLSRT